LKLSDLKNGEKAVIVKIKGHGAFRKRITEMGFVKGKLVEVVKNAPLHDPIEYKIIGKSFTISNIFTPTRKGFIHRLYFF